MQDTSQTEESDNIKGLLTTVASSSNQANGDSQREDSSPSNASDPKNTTQDPNATSIALAEFQLNQKLLGHGSFSEVTLAYRYYDQKTYAVKQINKERAQRKRVTKYVVNERRVLLMLKDHPNIVRLHWTARDMLNVYMFYEHLPHGELWEMLQKLPHKQTPLPLAQFWIAELVNTLEYLARMGVAHRDLKPENILLSKTWNLVVCDFGTAKVLTDLIDLQKRRQENLELAAKRFDAAEESRRKEAEEKNSRLDPEQKAKLEAERKAAAMAPRPGDTLSDEEHRRRSIAFAASRSDSFTGTPEYMAPELVKSKIPTALMLRAADLWALGVILYQFMAGYLPFRGGGAYAVFQESIKHDVVYPSSMPPEARDLINILLEPDPIVRLRRAIGDVGIFGIVPESKEENNNSEDAPGTSNFFANDDAYNQKITSQFKPKAISEHSKSDDYNVEESKPKDEDTDQSNSIPFGLNAIPKHPQWISFDQLRAHPFFKMTGGLSASALPWPSKKTGQEVEVKTEVPCQDLLHELYPQPIPQQIDNSDNCEEEVDETKLSEMIEREFPNVIKESNEEENESERDRESES